MGNLADALVYIADSSQNPEPASAPGLLSPIKKDRAWKMILKEGLPAAELAAARKIFRGNSEIADEYLSFGEGEEWREARLIWLRGELDRVGRD
jgi:hypothetical protein